MAHKELVCVRVCACRGCQEDPRGCEQRQELQTGLCPGWEVRGRPGSRWPGGIIGGRRLERLCAMMARCSLPRACQPLR